MKFRSLALLVFIAALPFGSYSQIAANLRFTKNPTCNGLCNGEASIAVTGGVAPYRFNWSSGAKDSCTVYTLCAGFHRVTVTDNGGSLPVTFTFTLTTPAKLNADTAGHGIATCLGTQITLTATGGTQPYTGTGTFTSPPGNYIYIVKDANNCQDTVPVSISAAPKIKVNVSILDTACPGGLANVIVSATGGYGSYTGTGAFKVAGGIHYFFVYDSLGCPAIDTVMIPQFPKSTVHITADSSTLCSSDSALIYLNSSFSSYLWSNGATTQNIYAKNAGNYYVTIMDTNRCKVESNRIRVNIHPSTPVLVSINGDTLTAYNAMGYQWLQNNTPIEGANQHMYVVKQAGSYAVDITDSNGCHAVSSSILITGIETIDDSELTVYPNPSADGNFKLTVTSSMIGSVAQVFDVSGKMIFQTEIRHITSSVAVDAPAGIYILRIQDGQNTLLRKLVKQ